GLDRRGRGRRAAAVALAPLPERAPLRRVRRPRDLGLRGLAAGQPGRAALGAGTGDRMSAPAVRLDTVERAVADIAAGRAVGVVDDEDRENEGDLIFAAGKATPDLMAFLIRYSSGVVCLPVTAPT